MAPFAPPFFLKNPHLQTILASKLRPTAALPMTLETLELPDGDFLSLCWHHTPGAKGLIVLSHGLEGHVQRPYIQGMARALVEAGWSVMAWNSRGCGPKTNRLPRLYHCGSSEDLAAAVGAVPRRYEQIALVGFSMGGNLSLLTLGREGDTLDPRVCAVVAISAPCDLADSIKEFESSPFGWVYSHYFLRSLRRKVLIKRAQFPDLAHTIFAPQPTRTLRQFDDAYTAPIHGFSGAEDYWHTSSSRPWLPRIAIPGLILNALDDPFLGGGCYPHKEARQAPNLTLKTPQFGGHVGFLETLGEAPTWAEKQVVEFLRTIM